MTDSPEAMRAMVSAISGATESWRILAQAWAACDRGMVLVTTTALSAILGNIIGGLAGYYSKKTWARTLDAIAMVIRPLPYYIFAFALILVFGWVVRWFPITGGASIGAQPASTSPHIQDVL